MEATANPLTPENISAGIDLGSNSFRLILVKHSATKTDIILKRLATVRLGAGLAASGILSSESMTYGLKVLEDFHRIIQSHNATSCRACGTAALRKAANAATFINRAEEILGVSIELLSGDEEARLSLHGALHGMGQVVCPPLMYADVGGGSTEILILREPHARLQIFSMDLGAVPLTEQYLLYNPPNSTTKANISNEIRARTAAALIDFGELDISDLTVVASGGTATALAALSLGLKEYQGHLVQNFFLSAEMLVTILHTLGKLTAQERNRLPGLDARRGEILLAGGMIYQELLNALNSPGMIISDAGLLEGIVFGPIHSDTAPSFFPL